METEALAGTGEPPSLLLSEDGSTLPPNVVALSPVAGGFSGTFEVGPGRPAVTLRIAGGAAFSLKAVDLSVLKPRERPPV
jgi:hypothetical protein